MSVSKFLIKEDSELLTKFKEEIEEIEFIKEKTKILFDELKLDVTLNIQSHVLRELWKSIIGDAIIFLKSKDSREKYPDKMILGVEKIFNFLEAYQEFELILYGSVDNYRDHVIHVFRVFLLGNYLIKNSFGYDEIKISDKLSISSEEKQAMWAMIALTHDLGYPFQGIHQINNKVRKIIQKFGPLSLKEMESDFFPQFEKISDISLRFISSDLFEASKGKYYTHIQPKYLQKYVGAYANYNHGVISSIMSMKDLVFFKESDYTPDSHKPLDDEDARQFIIRREILRSIASHSCDDIYHLTIPNFSFLLLAIDEMQEWGRPRLVDVTKRGDSKTELLIEEFNSTKLDYKITFSREGSHPIPLEIENTKEGIKNYFKSKCMKWMNVLRSAVGGKHRNLFLKFTTEDTITAQVDTYYLSHDNPAEYKVYPEGILDE